MITFRQKGDFSHLTKFLERAKEVVRLGDLDKYGRAGVAALASATPVDSGLTASSWSYEITNKNGTATISYCHHSAIRTCHRNRRLGRRARLHQPRYPAYF